MNIFLTGSQAVSSTNLTSDDTLSIRSMSVDETPDYDGRNQAPNDQQFYKSKNSISGIKSDIADLKHDMSDLKNEINDCKNDLNDPFQSIIRPAAKTPVLTPGSRNRINPFLNECIDEGLFQNNYVQQNTKSENSKNLINNNDKFPQQAQQVAESKFENNKSDTWVEPLGCLPVQSQIITSSSQTKITSGVSAEKEVPPVTNGQTLGYDDDAVTSDQSNPEGTSESKNDGSSVGSGGGYDSPYEGTSVVRTQLPPGKVKYIFTTYID